MLKKTKIGRDVKGIPKTWIEKQNNELYNHILLNQYPYFFKYLYKDANKKYKEHYDKYDKICNRKFGISIKELEFLNRKTTKQIKFLEDYYEYMPLIYSNSTMNLLCRYIEGINFQISQKIKISSNSDFYKLYKNLNFTYSEELYENIKNIINEYIRSKKCKVINNNTFDDGSYVYDEMKDLKEKFINLGCDINIIVNCLIDYFYIKKNTLNKDILWDLYGDIICQNVKNNSKNPIMFPLPDENGDILYMGKTYSYKEIDEYGF